MSIIEPFMWLLWDLLAVMIFFRCAYKCASRGFVSTIVSFLMYFAGALIAMRTYRYIARFLYDNVVYDAVRGTLIRNLDLALNNTDGADNILGAIPFILRVMMGHRRDMVGELPLDTAEVLSGEIIEVALKDPLMSALYAVGFLLAFSLAAFFMRYLSRLFSGVNNIPVIGAVNTVLGGIVGVLEGVVSLMISSLILHLLISFSGDAWWWLNDTIINSTYIWRLFY